MADQDELRLRIVPELDPDALAGVNSQLNNIPTTTTVGGKGKGAGAKESDALNQSIRTRIDLIDLESRKSQALSLDRVKQLQLQAAQGKITQGELIAGIEREEQARSKNTRLALRDYAVVDKQIQQTTELTERQAVALERKLLYATERAKNGMVSASRSMDGLTSNTKSANIAFANFGRIVQDAPFGLLGISNNIDPLLNSFRELRQESTSNADAFKKLGAQLIGPAGLIFMVGSLLPTALIFLQRHLQDTKKETNSVTDAVRSLQDQIAKGFAEAAAQMGIDELNAGLSVSTFRLEQEEKKLEDVKRQMTEYALRGMAMTEADRERGKALRDTQAQIEKNIEREKGIVTQFETQINLLKTREESEALYSQNSIGRAKTEQERAKTREEDNKRLLENFSIMQPLLALQLTFNDAIRESRDAYLAQAAAARIAQQAEATAFQERAKREAQRQGRDETLTSDKEYDRALNDRQIFEQQQIDLLRASGKEQAAIALEVERSKRDEKLRLLQMGITDMELINNALALIAQDGANRIKDNELTVADARVESMAIYADAVASGLGAIFGENKAIQSAQVVVDTYAGAQKAFAALAPNLPLQIAASGAVIAQGVAALRKINSTTKNSKSISRTSGGSSPSPRGNQFVNDLGAANMVAGTITPFGASMTPNINITANLDRQGLALAVRDGEADIATRQIPFAS